MPHGRGVPFAHSSIAAPPQVMVPEKKYRALFHRRLAAVAVPDQATGGCVKRHFTTNILATPR